MNVLLTAFGLEVEALLSRLVFTEEGNAVD